MLRNAYIDRILRSSFINQTGVANSKNTYKFNLYSENDITAIVNQTPDHDMMGEFIVQNKIDLLISINQVNSEFKPVDSKRIKVTGVDEQKFTKYTDMAIRKITFKTDVRKKNFSFSSFFF